MIINYKIRYKPTFEKEIFLNSNAVEILRFLMQYKDIKFTRNDIAKSINMSLHTVAGNLIKLQTENLIKKSFIQNNVFYSFIPQKEKIILKKWRE